MSKFDQQLQSPAYIQIEQQNRRHEIARLHQFINELENHIATLHSRLVYLGQGLSTPDQCNEYAQLLWRLNQDTANLNAHRLHLSSLIELANVSYGKNLSEQCRREIFHLYHAGRYTQAQLAKQYGVSQSAVSKIINGPVPAHGCREPFQDGREL
ncbi:helix-turn-helix transcriptional regulator [Methylomicrobium sp. Wu6]|nr:helix-turn-helix transcriptional regulator [Methylomicrobium sp. Wu6]